MPTLTQLEYILAVAKFRHFGAAAEACHVSQPSLSQQIQKAEEELNIVIFDRLKKPIVPTQKGLAVIEQAQVVLDENQKLIALSKNKAGMVCGEFRLGMIPTLAPYLIPLFINDFSKTYPKVLLKIDEIKTDTIIDEIKKDTLDAAILATPIHEEGIRERKLFYESFFLYANQHSSLGARKRIKESELQASEMWLLQDGHCLRNQVVRLCTAHNGPSVFKNIHFEGGNLETLRYLIKKGRGYTLIPELFLRTLPESEQRENIKEFENPAPAREISLIFRRGQWKKDILDAVESVVLKNLPEQMIHPFNKKKNHVVKI